MRRKLAMVLVLVLIGWTFPVANVARAATAVWGPASDPEYVLRIRSEFGLSTDPTYLSSLATDPSATTTALGVPLSAAETADIEGRPKGHDLIALDDYGAAHPDVWGGMFVDQRAGGIVDVAFTELDAIDVEALSKLVPSWVTLRPRVVRWSDANLAGVVDAVSSDIPSLADQGIIVFAALHDVINNRVDVQVRDPTIDVQLTLTKRYGDAVLAMSGPRPEPAACTRASCPTPWRGGLEITSVGGGSEAWCTSGFVGKRSSSYYLVTAGHCNTNGSQVTWYNSATCCSGLIGLQAYNAFYYSNTSADAMAISISSSAKSNYIYVSPSETQRTMTAAYSGSWTVGDAVCDSGYASGSNYCGTIISVGNTVSYLGRTFSDQTYTSIGHVISGDSGSPVFYSHALYGVVTASSGSGHSYFTPFDNIAAEFSVSPCLSSSC